jgi:hypothetical protein
MADNVVLPGTGGTIAADEIGGAQYQRVKVTWGADGSANDASSANPLPVTLPVDGDSALGKVKVMGKYWNDSTLQDLGAELTDYGYALAVVIGNSTNIPTAVSNFPGSFPDYGNGVFATGSEVATQKFAVISCASSGNNTIVAAVGGKQIRVLACSLTASAAVNAKFQSGAGGTDKTGLYYLAANGGFILPYNKLGWFETATSALLNLNLSGAVAVGGCLTYIEV